MAAVTEEERNAEGICLSVSDAQAETLRRLREHTSNPLARFASQMRSDGSRAVVRGGTSQETIANLDAEGYAVEVRDHRWHRVDAPWNPS